MAHLLWMAEIFGCLLACDHLRTEIYAFICWTFCKTQLPGNGGL